MEEFLSGFPVDEPNRNPFSEEDNIQLQTGNPMSAPREVIWKLAWGLLAIAIGAVCFSGRFVEWHFTSTLGTSHWQLSCIDGRLSVIRNACWWRVEPPLVVFDEERSNRGSRVVDSIGFRPESQSAFLGFEYAFGTYLSAFARVLEDTQFIPPFKPVKPGSMLRTTTKFTLWVIPVWNLLKLIGIFSAFYMSWKLLRRDRHCAI